MKKFILPTLIAVILLAGCQEQKQFAVFSGTIEGKEIPIQSELGASVKEMLLEEGSSVQAGQPAARLDDRLYRYQIDEAKAGVDAARAKYEEASAGSRSQDVDQAIAMVQQAQAAQDSSSAGAGAAAEQVKVAQASRMELEMSLAGARKTLSYQQDKLSREKELYSQQAVSRQDVDALEEAVNQASTQVADLSARIQSLDAQIAQAKNQQTASEAAVSQAEANEKAAAAKLDLLKAGSTDYTIRNLLSGIEQADSRLNQARLNEAKTIISAPYSGTILRRHVENGETIKPGATLYTLLEKGILEVVVYIPEAQLGQVKVGQQAYLSVDAYPGHSFQGKVTRIASEAEFTPKNVQTPDERTKMVFAVTVRLSEGLQQLKPGMPADITFQAVKAGVLK